MKKKNKNGKIYLVGAGPGDPGLLTLKAFKILSHCDVIIYDALLNSEILNYAPKKAEKIFVGTPRTKGRLDQREVESLMIAHASKGKTVVRLKGGDPFLFGRGGEEAEAITAAGLEWDIIPGVSSGHAVPAYAAIPVTHRDCASSVTFITGHESPNKSQIRWDKIRHNFNTLVIFMGAGNLKNIITQLLKSNYESSVPIAIIESGATPDQNVRVDTLGTVIESIAATPIKTPALIIIGEVVQYRDKLKKYMRRSDAIQ